MRTIEEWESLKAPLDLKFGAGALFRRGAGIWHIDEVAEMLGCKRNGAARLGSRMRKTKYRWNSSMDPAYIEVPPTCEWLVAFGHAPKPEPPPAEGVAKVVSLEQVREVAKRKRKARGVAA